MNSDVLSFKNIKINDGLLEEIWNLDPRTLDHIDGIELSTYALEFLTS